MFNVELDLMDWGESDDEDEDEDEGELDDLEFEGCL